MRRRVIISGSLGLLLVVVVACVNGSGLPGTTLTPLPAINVIRPTGTPYPLILPIRPSETAEPRRGIFSFDVSTDTPTVTPTATPHNTPGGPTWTPLPTVFIERTSTPAACNSDSERDIGAAWEKDPDPGNCNTQYAEMLAGSRAWSYNTALSFATLCGANCPPEAATGRICTTGGSVAVGGHSYNRGWSNASLAVVSQSGFPDLTIESDSFPGPCGPPVPPLSNLDNLCTEWYAWASGLTGDPSSGDTGAIAVYVQWGNICWGDSCVSEAHYEISAAALPIMVTRVPDEGCPTATPTNTATPTVTPTPSPTMDLPSTYTPTPTNTATPTVTPTPTVTSTPLPSATPTATSPMATRTVCVGCATPLATRTICVGCETLLATRTVVVTNTPVATRTPCANCGTPLGTRTPLLTNTPVATRTPYS